MAQEVTSTTNKLNNNLDNLNISTREPESFVHVQLTPAESTFQNGNADVTDTLDQLDVRNSDVADHAGGLADGITGLSDQLEDLVNNVVDDEANVIMRCYVLVYYIL